MLGMIHRTVLGMGPGQFTKFFRRKVISRNPDGREQQNRHNLQLVSYRTAKFLDLISNSVLGLIDIYNLLPCFTVAATDVQEFQKRLQTLLKEMAKDGAHAWETLYSPRGVLHNNRLRKMYNWCPKK